jgi:apolipoprotein N-acyltransferase
MIASLLAAFALGLLVAFGFAPYGIWPLALLGYAGLALLLGERAGSRRGAFGIGWCFGLGQFVLGLDWIAQAFTFQAAMPAWLGWIAVVLLSLYLAVFPGLAALAAWWATRRIGGGAASLSLFLGAAWAASEWLRSTAFTGFAWNPAAVAFVDLPLAQVARLIGTYALSGVIVASAGFVLILATTPRERLGRRTLFTRANIPALIGLIVLAGLYFAPGIAVYTGQHAPPPPATGPLITVVQPMIGQGERWNPTLGERHLAREIALSGKPGPIPRILLWSESAFEDDVAEAPEIRAEVTPLLGPKDVVFGGGVQPIRNADGAMIAARNSSFVIDAAGGIVGRYDKAHLVPYGEYLPMRPILSRIGLSRLAPGDLDFRPGPGARTITLPTGVKVGVQICYEMVFSGHVVDEDDRPDFIFNPSNDSWFGRAGPPQHLAQARLRAIEEGLPVARATPTGISALIAPDGRIVDKLDAGAMGMFNARLPAPVARPLFTYMGNWMAGIAALLMVALAFVAGTYKEGFI